jgi:hypothetical protein
MKLTKKQWIKPEIKVLAVEAPKTGTKSDGFGLGPS